LASVVVVVVAAIGEQLPRPAADRRDGGDQRDESMSSLWLPLVKVIARVMPPASQITWCVDPGAAAASQTPAPGPVAPGAEGGAAPSSCPDL